MNRELENARSLARWLDRAFRIPGTNIRFGLDPLLGLVPGIGDVVAGAGAAYMLVIASRVGAPRSVMLRMVWNLAVDAVVGAVPVAGDVFDVGYKANVRNLELLERWLAAPAQARRSSRLFLATLLVLVALLIAGGVWLAIVIVRALAGAIG